MCEANKAPLIRKQTFEWNTIGKDLMREGGEAMTCNICGWLRWPLWNFEVYYRDYFHISL